MYRLITSSSGPMNYSESFHSTESEAIEQWHRTGHTNAVIRQVKEDPTQNEGWSHVCDENGPITSRYTA